MLPCADDHHSVSLWIHRSYLDKGRWVRKLFFETIQGIKEVQVRCMGERMSLLNLTVVCFLYLSPSCHTPGSPGNMPSSRNKHEYMGNRREKCRMLCWINGSGWTGFVFLKALPFIVIRCKRLCFSPGCEFSWWEETVTSWNASQQEEDTALVTGAPLPYGSPCGCSFPLVDAQSMNRCAQHSPDLHGYVLGGIMDALGQEREISTVSNNLLVWQQPHIFSVSIRSLRLRLYECNEKDWWYCSSTLPPTLGQEQGPAVAWKNRTIILWASPAVCSWRASCWEGLFLSFQVGSGFFVYKFLFFPSCPWREVSIFSSGEVTWLLPETVNTALKAASGELYCPWPKSTFFLSSGKSLPTWWVRCQLCSPQTIGMASLGAGESPVLPAHAPGCLQAQTYGTTCLFKKQNVSQLQVIIQHCWLPNMPCQYLPHLDQTLSTWCNSLSRGTTAEAFHTMMVGARQEADPLLNIYFKAES